MERRAFTKTLAGVGAVALLPLPLVVAAAQGEELATDGLKDRTEEKPLRSVEVLGQSGWSRVSWAELKKDAIFRLREAWGPDAGEIADAGQPDEVSLATKDAVWVDTIGTWSVTYDPLTKMNAGDEPHAPNIKMFIDGGLVGLVESVDFSTMTLRRYGIEAAVARLSDPFIIPLLPEEPFHGAEYIPPATC